MKTINHTFNKRKHSRFVLTMFTSLLLVTSSMSLAIESKTQAPSYVKEADDKEQPTGTICLLLPQFCRSEAQ